MTRESEISSSTGLDRRTLRAARRSGIYEEGVHFGKVGSAYCWTDAGREKLSVELGVSAVDLESGERRAVVLPGSLQSRLIRAKIDGFDDPQVVVVGNNRLYRPGMEVLVERTGNGWSGRRRPRRI